MPFGERKLKLSNGEKIIVLDVIRNAIPTRIVSQYLAYCDETIATDEFKPLATSSLFAILQKCSASTRKSLAGLDNFSSDGSTAFDQLQNLCDDMISLGKDWANSWTFMSTEILQWSIIGTKSESVARLKRDLHDGRDYLKLDYKTHVATESKVADHCSKYALSDKTNAAWRDKCDHDHDAEYN